MSVEDFEDSRLEVGLRDHFDSMTSETEPLSVQMTAGPVAKPETASERPDPSAGNDDD